MFNWQYSSTVSDNGLEPLRRQVIFRSNDASRGPRGKELNYWTYKESIDECEIMSLQNVIRSLCDRCNICFNFRRQYLTLGNEVVSFSVSNETVKYSPLGLLHSPITLATVTRPGSLGREDEIQKPLMTTANIYHSVFWTPVFSFELYCLAIRVLYY